MNNKLYELIKEDGEITDDFIYSVFDIIKTDDILPYIKDFRIYNQDSSNYGTYSNEERTITINKYTILKKTNLSNKRIKVLEVLLHEMNHAKSLKKIYDCKNDIETVLLQYSFYDYMLNNGMIFFPKKIDGLNSIFFNIKKYQNYSLDPNERLSRINSWKYIVNLLKNERGNRDLLEARVNLYYAYIRGYKLSEYYFNPPSYEFLLKMGFYEDFYLLKNRVEKNNYKFDTRLHYGLPLSESEYNDKILKKVLLKKKNI